MNRNTIYALISAGAIGAGALAYWAANLPPGTCSDGLPSRDETDIDCGGPSCNPCDLGKMCLRDADCASGECNNNLCRRRVSSRVIWWGGDGAPAAAICRVAQLAYDPNCPLNAETDDVDSTADDDPTDMLERPPASGYPYAVVLTCWNADYPRLRMKAAQQCFTMVGDPRPIAYDPATMPRLLVRVRWDGAEPLAGCRCGAGVIADMFDPDAGVKRRFLKAGEKATNAQFVQCRPDAGPCPRIPCEELNFGRASSIMPAACCANELTGMECGEGACGNSAGNCEAPAVCLGHACIYPDAGGIP